MGKLVFSFFLFFISTTYCRLARSRSCELSTARPPSLSESSEKSNELFLDLELDPLRHHTVKKIVLSTPTVDSLFLFKPNCIAAKTSCSAVLPVYNKDRSKIFLLKICKNEDFDDLVQEYMLTKTLKHENIRACNFHPRQGKVLGYLHLEYLPGNELHQLLTSTEKLTEPRLTIETGSRQTLAAQFIQVDRYVYILKCILKALAYLKKKGIVHGDIKLQNVIVSSNFKNLAWIPSHSECSGLAPSVKLIDFGLSFREGETVKYGGTTMFACYEKLTRKPVSYPTDVFAFSIIFWSVFTNTFPTDQDKIVTRMRQDPLWFPDYIRRISTRVRDGKHLWLKYKPINSVFFKCFTLLGSQRASAKKLLRFPLFTCSSVEQLILHTV